MLQRWVLLARHTVRRAAVASVLGAVALGVAACSDGGPEPAPVITPSQTPAATPSPTVDAAEKDASDKALAAYNGYRETVVTASGTADYHNPDLATFVADPLLTEIRLSLRTQGEQGMVSTGRPTWTPQVSGFNGSPSPYSVEITDCLDTTNWNTVYKATGKSAAVPGQAKRFVVTSTVGHYQDGTWRVKASKVDRSRGC